MAQGISAVTLDRAFAGVRPIPRIIELDHSQPETTLTFAQYIERVVPPARREAAHQRYVENKALLDEIGRRYGVQPRYIVALWGIETDFGRTIGTYPVVAALATLAYDGRRAAFFRRELIDALRIIQDDKIEPAAMIGSWAGAMGQSQFMPSSFLAFAVSYRGKAAPDIWTRKDDVFASIANYLSRSGWHGDQAWGEEVTAPAKLELVADRTRKEENCRRMGGARGPSCRWQGPADGRIRRAVARRARAAGRQRWTELPRLR